MLVLQTLIASSVIIFAVRYIVKPRTLVRRFNVAGRLFLAMNIVIFLCAGSILATSYPQTNSVLRFTSDNAFLIGLCVVLFGLFSLVVSLRLWEMAFVPFKPVVLGSEPAGFGGERGTWSEVCLLALSAFCICCTLWVVIVSGVPQLYSEDQLAAIRIGELHTTTSVPSLVRKIFARDLSFVLALVAIAKLNVTTAVGSRRSVMVLVCLYLLLICIVYNYSFELSKSEMVKSFLGIACFSLSCRMYCGRKLPGNIKIAASFLLILMILYFMFLLSYPDRSFFNVGTYFFQRVFVSQISPFFGSIQLWLYDIRLGDLSDISAYFAEVLRISPFEAPAQRLTGVFFPAAYEAGKMNYLSSWFVAESLIIGGPIGALISIIIVNFQVGFLLVSFAYIRPFVWYGPLVTYCLVFSSYMSSVLPFITSASFVVIFCIVTLGSKRFFFLKKRSLP